MGKVKDALLGMSAYSYLLCHGEQLPPAQRKGAYTRLNSAPLYHRVQEC